MPDSEYSVSRVTSRLCKHSRATITSWACCWSAWEGTLGAIRNQQSIQTCMNGSRVSDGHCNSHSCGLHYSERSTKISTRVQFKFGQIDLARWLRYYPRLKVYRRGDSVISKYARDRSYQNRNSRVEQNRRWILCILRFNILSRFTIFPVRSNLSEFGIPQNKLFKVMAKVWRIY